MTEPTTPAVEPYATAQDLADRWRALTPDELDRATVLLEDASAYVRTMCTGVDDRITAGSLDSAVVRSVVVGMVKRAMLAGESGEGVGQQSQTAGPYSQSLTFTNPTGALYLTKSDRRLLGCRGSGGRAFSIDPTPTATTPDLTGDRDDWWQTVYGG